MNTQKLIPFILLTALAIGMVAVVDCSRMGKDEIPVTTSSKDALALFNVGRDLSDRNRFPEANECFKKAVALDTNFALAYYYCASTGSTNKEFIDNINRAATLVDKISEGEKLRILGYQALLNGNSVQEKEAFEKLVQLYPKDKRAYEELGVYYFRKSEFSKAIGEFQKAISIDPKFAGPYNMMGYAYLYLGQYAEAEKALKKYIDLIPGDANPYDSLGEILMKQGKFDESIEAYKKAIAIDSNFLNSTRGIGYDLMFKEKPDEAKKKFQEFYEKALDDGQRQQAIFSVVILYIDGGRYGDALKEVQKSYAISDKNMDVTSKSNDLNAMGDILLEQGKVKEAKEKYDQSVEVIEKSDLSKGIIENAKQYFLFKEAMVALKNGDLTAGKSKASEYQRLAEAGKDTNEIQASHELKGMIALQEKRLDDALKELSQADQRNPRNLCRMAEAYEAKGDQVKAKEMWSRAANFNEMSYNYAFVRNMAKKKLTSL